VVNFVSKNRMPSTHLTQAGQASELAWTFQATEEPLLPTEIRTPDYSARSIFGILTTLSLLLIQSVYSPKMSERLITTCCKYKDDSHLNNCHEIWILI
jgi:hypothetical protein